MGSYDYFCKLKSFATNRKLIYQYIDFFCNSAIIKVIEASNYMIKIRKLFTLHFYCNATEFKKQFKNLNAC